MRILIVHNEYGKYSGEEVVVDRMIADAKRAGYEIETLRTTSRYARENILGKIHGFFSGIYSIQGRRKMRKALRKFIPDIVHIHNLYPFISPAVLPLCRKEGVKVVMTVHNYRLICPTGLFLRDGKPCENCLKKGNERDCIRFNCEHDRFRSLGYALRNAFARHMRYYLDNVDYFCCLTDFQRQKLIDAGFAPERIKVIPNYIKKVKPEEPNATTDKWGTGYIGYVGRLSHEKGYDMFIEVARRHPELKFQLAGILRPGEKMELPPNVNHCGHLSPTRLARFYENSAFIVIPSRCYEGFPTVLLEAAMHKHCCIVPNHGAFPEIMTDLETGEKGSLLFTPLDVDDLERKIVQLSADHDLMEKLSSNAFNICKNRYAKHIINKKWDYFLSTVGNTKRDRQSF